MSADTLQIRPGLELPGWSMTEDFVLAGGPGGQNVNKNAAKDGGILIEARRHRTQERNREDARERLKQLVLKALEPPPPPRRKTRPTRGSVERRLKAKTVRGEVKRRRGKISDDD